MKETFNRHAIQHHKLKRFDINIDIPTWWVLALGSPVLVTLAFFRLWVELAVFTTIIVLYAWVWTGMHRATHDLGGRWSTYLPFYERIRSHHLEHHRRPGKNFGTIFMSLLDKPLGTQAKKASEANHESIRN